MVLELVEAGPWELGQVWGLACIWGLLCCFELVLVSKSRRRKYMQI